MRRGATSLLLLLLATTLAHAESDIARQLNETYVRDSGETAQLAARLLEKPAQLTTFERIDAQAYQCEALEDLDRIDEAIERSGSALATLAVKPGKEESEPAARLVACAGFLAKRKGKLAEALSDFDRAQTFLDPSTMWLTLSFVLYRRAGLYDTLGNHAEALTDLTRALELLKDRERDHDVAAQYSNIASAIGRIHLHRHDYAQALPYYSDLLEYIRRNADPHAEGIVEINLGECYRGLKRFEEAAQAYQRAVDVGTRTENPTLSGRANVGLGALARENKDYAASLKYLTTAREAFKATGGKLDAASADLERAQTLADMQDWRALAKLSASLLGDLDSIGDKHLLRQAHQLKARAEEGNGDIVAALADERDSARLQDDIQRHEFDDELAKRSVQFDVAELEDKARMLARENEFAQAEVAREHEINLLQRGIILLAAGAVLLLIVSVRRHLKTGRLLTRLANEDALTGIDNRRATLAAAGDAFARSRSDGSLLSLALIDIDHFKQINDQFGHAAGDAVLVEVAASLRARLRGGNDICGRVGGEEFLLALPERDLKAAVAILDRLREAIGELHFAAPADRLRVTFSAGCTLRTPADDSLETLVRRADSALYAAKRGGRDRIETQDAAAS